MNRTPTVWERLGNLLAFGGVLAILMAGCYAVYGIAVGERTPFSLGGAEEVRPTVELVVAPPTLTPLGGVAVAESTATLLFQPPTPAPPTETLVPVLEATLPISATAEPPPDTPTVAPLPPSATLVPTPTSFPTSTSVPPTATVVPTSTPLPTIPPPPPTITPIPVTATPAFLFRVAAAGPDYSRGCTGPYIFGYLRDAVGNPLPGLRVRATNQFGAELPPSTSKTEPPGWYDIVISAERAVWYVQVVDAANDPLSPIVEVLNTGNFVQGSEACWHQVDFTRNN